MIFKSCSRRQQARHRPPVPSTYGTAARFIFGRSTRTQHKYFVYPDKLGTVQVWYISTCIRTVIRVRRRSHNVSTVTVRTLYCTIMGYRTTVRSTYSGAESQPEKSLQSLPFLLLSFEDPASEKPSSSSAFVVDRSVRVKTS